MEPILVWEEEEEKIYLPLGQWATIFLTPPLNYNKYFAYHTLFYIQENKDSSTCYVGRMDLHV
jgi:hypothetical protein